MPLEIGNHLIRENPFPTLDEPPLDVESHSEGHKLTVMLGSFQIDNWKPNGEYDKEVSGIYAAPTDCMAEASTYTVWIPAHNRHKATPLVPNSKFDCSFYKFLPDGSLARAR